MTYGDDTHREAMYDPDYAEGFRKPDHANLLTVKQFALIQKYGGTDAEARQLFGKTIAELDRREAYSLICRLTGVDERESAAEAVTARLPHSFLHNKEF